MTTKNLARLLSSLLALSLVLIASEARATPKIGSKELRIGQHYQPPLNLTDGFIRLEPERGEGLSGMGLGAGMGFFLTDNVELGLSLSLQMVKSGGNTLFGPGAEPFARFIFIQGKVGFFVEADAEIRRLSSDNNASTIIGLGADIGLEFFVTDDWAVRVAPTFRHLIINNSASAGGVTVSNEETGNRFGITWGLACYF
jgi:hypothetical protein